MEEGSIQPGRTLWANEDALLLVIPQANGYILFGGCSTVIQKELGVISMEAQGLSPLRRWLESMSDMPGKGDSHPHHETPPPSTSAT